jgi:RimJ/RimL family protein N-acetyltransferase
MISNNSDKIELRPIELTDLSLIQQWRNQKSIQPFVREYRELSNIHIDEWYRSIITNDKFEFFIIENTDHTPIGVTGLTYIDWINRNADLHLAIYHTQKWIDNIYAPEVLNVMLTYAFNFLNLEKIYAEVYEIDSKKVNFFMSNGFNQDAILRNHYYYNGEYVNSFILSILKNEFYEKCK